MLRCEGVRIWLETCDSNFNVERCQKNSLKKEQQNAKNEEEKKKASSAGSWNKSSEG